LKFWIEFRQGDGQEVGFQLALTRQ
jgi:hypothetical protein